MTHIHNIHLEPIIDRALQEDWGNGDWTTDLCIPRNLNVKAKLYANEEMIVAGIEVITQVFRRVSESLELNVCVKEGDYIPRSTAVLEVMGEARAILKAERVALKFLSRMSGIATTTRKYIEKIEGYKAQLLDTRNMSPGLRIIEKAATAIGGARNHRLCLIDGVLIRKNHVIAAGSITSAINRLLESLPPTLKIEVEVSNLAEVHEALNAGADLISLLNMSLSEMSLAVRTVRGRVLLQATGHVTLDNIEKIAKTEVDFISTNSILHTAPWVDLNLKFEL